MNPTTGSALENPRNEELKTQCLVSFVQVRFVSDEIPFPRRSPRTMEEEIDVRIEDEPSVPERTFAPIMYMSWLLGVGVARPRTCPKWITVVLRAVHFAVCSVIVAYSVTDFTNFGKQFTSKLFEIMYCANEAVRHLAAYYYVYHAIRHYDKWPELMRLMECLDGNIAKELPIDNGPARTGQVIAILIVFIFGPASLAAHVVYYYLTAPDQIFASDLLLYYTIAQTLANSFVFDLVVYAICHRCRTVNRMIKRLDQRSATRAIASKVRKIRRLHNEICTVIMAVNDIYGVDLLLFSTNAFIMIVAKLFRIYMSAAERKIGFIFLNNVIWMIYGGQFIGMCWVCTLTQREINKIGLHVNEFQLNVEHSSKIDKIPWGLENYRGIESQRLERFNNNRFGGYHQGDLNVFDVESIVSLNFERDCVRNEANDFSLQLQQYRITFTACDFFEMDNSLLTRFISVITTYLIILVQFYKPESI